MVVWSSDERDVLVVVVVHPDAVPDDGVGNTRAEGPIGVPRDAVRVRILPK